MQEKETTFKGPWSASQRAPPQETAISCAGHLCQAGHQGVAPAATSAYFHYETATATAAAAAVQQQYSNWRRSSNSNQNRKQEGMLLRFYKCSLLPPPCGLRFEAVSASDLEHRALMQHMLNAAASRFEAQSMAGIVRVTPDVAPDNGQDAREGRGAQNGRRALDRSFVAKKGAYWEHRSLFHLVWDLSLSPNVFTSLVVGV